MTFAEKVKELRKNLGLTQQQVSDAIGMSKRAYIRYETGESYPRNRDIYQRLADVFKCNVNYLLTEDTQLVEEAEKLYGHRGKKQAVEIANQLSAMFAGGELSEEDVDEVMASLSEAYFIAKQNNRKYVPKKYRKE